MSRIPIPALLILIFAIPACSGSSGPGAPDIGGSGALQTAQNSVSTSGRYVLGAWELYFDRIAMTAEAVPVRQAEEHFNVRRFMENGPCTNCLRLLNLVGNPDQSFTIDVQFEHPFPGLDKFTGFDVRGIAIWNGSYVFPSSGLRIADHTLGDVELLNADGYTTLFNPVDFPEGSDIPIFTYSKGKKSTPLVSPSILNGYKAFFPDEPRRIFRAGEIDTRNYHIAWPAGTKLRVGYVVDANWEPAKVSPPNDPLTDFGPNANCIEAYQVSAVIGSGLMPGCGFAPYQVDVWDHQGFSTISGVSFEAPELFNGIVANQSGTDMGAFTRFTGNLPNSLKVGEGVYRVLVGVDDNVKDPKFGKLTAYLITSAKVESAPIDYDGGWRKQGRTLDNNNYNSHETTLGANLSPVWVHQFEGASLGSVFDGTPVVGTSAVYAVASIPTKEEIWALNLDTGDPIWHKFIKLVAPALLFKTTPTVGNCEVYVGGSSVIAYGSEDGDFLWSTLSGVERYTEGGPVVIDGKVIAWGNDNKLRAYDQFTGISKWTYTTGTMSGNPGTPAYDNGIVYAGDATGHAFALSAGDGSEIWKVQFPAGGPIVDRAIIAQPVLAGGLVWVGSWNCHLYGLNPANGAIVHDIPLGNQLPVAGPAFDGVHLYQPTAYYVPYQASFTGPYHVYAFNTDGSTAWTHNGSGDEAFFSSPAVANNVVFVASDAGFIYMLDPSTGNQTGQGVYSVGHSVTGGISIQNGRLYFMDSSGLLHCMRSE